MIEVIPLLVVFPLCLLTLRHYGFWAGQVSPTDPFPT